MLSGSKSMECDVSGQCACRPHFYGVKCEQLQVGYYAPSFDQMTYSSLDASE